MNEKFWSDLYGWLKFEAGCSLGEIEAMTLEDVRLFADYAKDHPPLRRLVSMCAGALGIKLAEHNPSQEKSKYLSADEFKRIVDETRGGAALGIGSQHG